MIKLLQQLEESRTPTGAYKPVRTFFKIELEETGNERPIIDRCTEYEMNAIVGVRFWANKAQLDDASRSALLAVAHGAFKDVIADLQRLRSTIYADEPGEALRLVDEIQNKLTEVG